MDERTDSLTSMANQADNTPSSIYSVIPPILRSRIPILTSLRQSARSVVVRPLLHSRSVSTSTYDTEPMPVSASRRSSISTITTFSVTTSGASTPRPASEQNDQALLCPNPLDVASANPSAHVGGVDWNTADAGVRLWLSARGQAELIARDPILLRSMHIDAIKYMNMALPNDLSEIEMQTLRASLPSRLQNSDHGYREIVAASKPNLLRQGVAQCVCWIIALLLVVIPLTMTVLNRLLIYEREHRITQRALKSSTEAVRTLSERGLDLSDTFVRFKDTPLGRGVLDALAWLVEGIAGGLNDGLVQSAKARHSLLRLQ